ncbi:uncharacterized protein LOC132553892 [Ylistrum balloti]|uniref:uncharacterized protein LOC132553892 n=1 Tax=Ylistrum balloti TaxID=509963 RepID=UPI002905C2B5|nr:uncharacterized protein LOC132553892 [Ylistrum balloti]
MKTDQIVGTWFPSGYYGHFRSKSRNDFCNEYRNLARPQPPKKFFNRSKQPTPRHVFSHHDNRESFLNDALYFEQGLGRKRVPNETYNFKRDFITWMPEKEYIERSRPLVSTYKVDFKNKRTEITKCSSTISVEHKEHHNIPQIMVKRPKTSFDGVPTTSYRYSHGDYKSNPNKELITSVNNEALQLSLLNRKNRAMSAKSSGRESVASCMIWNSAKTEAPSSNGKSRIPEATATTMFVPHPPPPRETAQPEKQVTVTSPPTQMEQTVSSSSMPAPVVAPLTNIPQPTIVWTPPQAEVAC